MQNQAFRMSEISFAWMTSQRVFKISINLGGPAWSVAIRQDDHAELE